MGIFDFFKAKDTNKTKMSNEMLREASKISIFGEGVNYWRIYEPVIKELIKLNCPVRYYTMDKNDPILSIENELLKTDYIGKGAMAFFKLSTLDANILLTTTPNIGTKGYPVAKSPGVKSLIHLWHSFGDFTYSSYRKYSLDSFDEIITTGEYMEPQIRYIEKKRNLPKKKIILCGVTYLEKLLEEIPETKKTSDKKTIIIAPSWGQKSLLQYYPLSFIEDLHNAGFRIIIRPHPQTIKSETQLLESYKQQLKHLDNLIWDLGDTNENYLAQADLMFSDTSSVRLDFRVLYNKPVITFDTPTIDFKDYEYDDLKDLIADSPMDDEIGKKIYLKDIGNIVEIANNYIDNHDDSKLDLIINKYCANFKHASSIIAKYLVERKKELDKI